MAKVPNGMNEDYVEYFPLEEYVDRIILSPLVLEHLQDTNHDFIEYIKKLSKYDPEYIMNYWVYLLYTELKYSRKIENIEFDKIDLTEDSVFFDTLAISHKRIHELHNFAMVGEEPSFSYRTNPVNVSRYNRDGKEEIFWRGVNPEDINKFMNDFIKIYKHSDLSILMSNPFLKSALVHLLFVRIQPYGDGNGRTARLLHNAKFTSSINKIYGTRLKLSPLNLSESIYLNKPTYARALDNIYFDLKHDNNDAINDWFNVMLNMVDEQIYASSNKVDSINKFYLQTSASSSEAKMRIRSLK
jgi:Fic family protein